MDFFGDYSIETASCHPSALTRPEDDIFAPHTLDQPLSPISPRKTRTSYPSDIINISHLTRQFGLQNLDNTAKEHPMLSPSLIEYTTAPDMSSHNGPLSPLRRGSVSAPRGSPCWKRRMQRQSNSHLLTDPAHLRSISEMVQRMVESSDQCGVVRRKPADLVPTPATLLVDDDDEDANSSDSGSPRSLSSSSTNGRDSSYYGADGVTSPPYHRRQFDSVSISQSLSASRVHKNRTKRRPIRR